MLTHPREFLEGLPSNDEIQARINTRVNQLYNDRCGSDLTPYVCSVCDEFILRKKDIRIVSIRKMKKARDLLSWEANVPANKRIPAIEASYQFPHDIPGETDSSWLKGMALSPRGSLHQLHSRIPAGFVTCDSCKECVEKVKMPFYAIINKNYIGCAPPELLDLNDVERSFLTPIKSYGYFFKYEGGSMKLMNGNVTFMRVEERKVAESVMTLECMGLTKHVIVMTCGKMTQRQYNKVLSMTQVRTDKMIAAVKWLVANHEMWKNVDLDAIVEKIGRTNPIRVDKHTTVESKNATVEDEVVFNCYYPDGASNTRGGGFHNPNDFKAFVEEMKEKNYDVVFKANIEKEFVTCSDGDHLIGACLLQFPYGVGSMNETRVQRDGKLISKVDLSDFLTHLSKKADPEFQTSMFQLIMYSMKNRARLLKTSSLQLKQKMDAKSIAEGFNSKNFSEACKARRKRKRKGTKVSNVILDACDATARDLPHTDASAKKARSSMESMFHHLGMGSIFLTVTFDDENSLLMQVLSGIEVDKGEDINDLTDEELSARAKSRQTLRFEFPGIAALNFEVMLNILLEEVIGWDIDENCPMNGKTGLFGDIKAMAFAVEEQGRKTLHVHFILWVHGYQDLQKMIFFGDQHQKPAAEGVAKDYYDRLASTKLFSTNTKELLKSFDHECTVPIRFRELPDVPCNQELRYLRHKKGFEHANGEFASCPHCEKVWTYEELATDYLEKGEGIKGPINPVVNAGTEPVVQLKKLKTERLYGEIVSFQHPSREDRTCPVTCINAAYQSHASCHHKNCFKCAKLKGQNKRNHVCGKNCECRYRLPDKSRKRSRVLTEHEGTSWFAWNGSEYLQPLVQFVPQRNTYDLFQNVSCTAISQSKFSCNSNISLITDGPIGMYSCKYINKPNEKDDTTEYAQVEASLKQMEKEGKKHTNEKSEALRIICRAAFAHNRSNIISSSMASYLTRHDSRFYFSHIFQFCPLNDVVRLHNRQDVSSTVNIAKGGTTFFENQALHYLCRPEVLENVSLKEFTEKWAVTYVKKNDDDIIPFEADTGVFKHPSATTTGKGERRQTKVSQGVMERDFYVHAKVPQWAFPDTSSFRNNILTCSDSDINRAMEKYAQLVLTLLVPHRSSNQLESMTEDSFPCAHRLREIHDNDMERRSNGLKEVVFTPENEEFLQNIQNAAHNSLRYKFGKDELAKETDPFVPDQADGMNMDDSEEDEDEDSDMFGYEEFLQSLEREFDRPMSDDDPQLFMQCMNNFSFKHIRNSGDNQCGYKQDIELPDLQVPEEAFVQTISYAEYNAREQRNREKAVHENRKKYGVKDITKVLLQRTIKSHRNVWKGKSINVRGATGTIRSIREWSKAGFGSDAKQQRAFETIIAAFLLTFYDIDGSGMDGLDSGTASTTQEKRQFRRTYNALLKLKGHATDPQLICLLHGPGGSGKSTVINMVTAYARSYCQQLNHPFTHRTITLTAMSGVAATLLHGETAHMALGMNRKKPTTEMISAFADARLVIIDEISFASVQAIEKIQACLSALMEKSYRSYGGVNVVFAGDYFQLDPVRASQRVQDTVNCPEFHHSLNCFIELDGTHRFRDDPEWGERLLRFRNGTATLADIEYINTHCHVSNKAAPKEIQVATYYNRNRDAINAAIFEDWCEENRPDGDGVLEQACVILMDNLQMSTSTKAYADVDSNQVKRFFYQNCGEDDCKLPESGRGRVDPMLKLYPNCPMMLTQNTDVPNGQANGSRVRVKAIKAIPDEEPQILKLDCGTKIKALFASQVQSIVVEHESDDIVPRVFEATIENFSFSTKLEIGAAEMKVNMKGSQFPLISNSCTTGHKLQGCTVTEILVNDWVYSQNWAYVVLSRVRTMAGLFLREELSTDLKKYKKDNSVLKMLKTFRENIAVGFISDQEYENIMRETELDIEEVEDDLSL